MRGESKFEAEAKRFRGGAETRRGIDEAESRAWREEPEA